MPACLQGAQLGYLLQASTSWSPTSCCGMLLWLLGWLTNLHSDAVLRGLRKPGESGGNLCLQQLPAVHSVRA
jgi:hypothetical protein